MSYEIKQALCQTLLNLLLIGMGVFLICSFGEMWREVKDMFRELCHPEALKEFFGMAAVMVVWVSLFFVL